MTVSEQDEFFRRLAGLPAGIDPHPWQSGLAADTAFGNRLIRIPTGFGKTFGVLGAWAWNRLQRADNTWPRRLVWCLPMRVLVEQVVAEVHSALQRLGGAGARVSVHALMGGVDADEWQLFPEREAVLVGTQDMLLSRALNRGYAAPRARWPMEFGLLAHDCLWVLDEVQLMDVGLATSAQLQAFRDEDAPKALRPCRTWWMSATLQPDWLACSPDTRDLMAALPPVACVPALARTGRLWSDVHKPVRTETAAGARQVAALVAREHAQLGRGASGPTLVVLNRVDRALEVFDLLCKDKALRGTDVRLVHSRFRPAERAAWRSAFLNREACAAGTDRIVVATQVVEAGVDISSALLVTDMAPWPSLVQRFGRAARWGGQAQVIVIDSQPKDDKAAAPYAKPEMDAARDALARLHGVTPLELEAFEEAHPELLPALYPYEPAHLLLRQELDELFDTAADLSGADIDISRYIRSGEERDVQVFWREVNAKAVPDPGIRAARDELCAVPFLRARDWLCGKGSERLKPRHRAWIWNWLEGRWQLPERRDIHPGRTLLVAADVGGYDPLRGWDEAAPAARFTPVPGSAVDALADTADDTEDDESLSVTAQWQTIGFHGRQVGLVARYLAATLAPGLAALLDLAGRWHDVGKIHPAFQGSIKPHAHGAQIAKAPAQEWHRGVRLYGLPDGTRRGGFRHELASTLALFALLQRCQPDHSALLGPWRDLLDQAGMAPVLPAASAALPEACLSPLEREVLALSAGQVDLLLYLVCSHHGKVRMAWHASPADQAAGDDVLRIRGVRSGDVLPPLLLAAADGSGHWLPAADMVLAPAAVGLNPVTGRGWTERVLGLLQQHGPFALAWLEAVMRAADQRASRDAALVDPALQADNGTHGLDGRHSPLAGPARGGETPPPLGGHPAQRGLQHGLRGRAGGCGDAGSGTRAPPHATRYVETQLGPLSYQALAPHLGRAAREVEASIESGAFDDQALNEHLIADLHRRLCGALTPQLLGWRRSEVLVGTHTPPLPHRVPELMHTYALDLQARLGVGADAGSADALLEALAYAEGGLLSIHPFADFNGRTTRLFLRLLLRRLDLPTVALAPPPEAAQAYLEALRAADQRDWRPLCGQWRQRFLQAEAS